MLSDDVLIYINEFICKKTLGIEKDIIESLRNGKLKGYATDVVDDEFGNIKNSELIKRSDDLNIIVTPHIGGMTKEAQEIAYNGIINKIKKNERKLV